MDHTKKILIAGLLTMVGCTGVVADPNVDDGVDDSATVSVATRELQCSGTAYEFTGVGTACVDAGELAECVNNGGLVSDTVSADQLVACLPWAATNQLILRAACSSEALEASYDESVASCMQSGRFDLALAGCATETVEVFDSPECLDQAQSL